MPEGTSATRRAHRRETWLQIYGRVWRYRGRIALGLTLLLVLFRAARPAQFSIVADGLLICFTLLPCIVGALLILILIAALALGTWAFNRWLPPRFKRVQHWADRLGGWTATLARAAAGPVIGLSVWLARQEHIAKGLGSILRLNDRRTDERD